jgi:hypothetical protein
MVLVHLGYWFDGSNMYNGASEALLVALNLHKKDAGTGTGNRGFPKDGLIVKADVHSSDANLSTSPRPGWDSMSR